MQNEKSGPARASWRMGRTGQTISVVGAALDDDRTVMVLRFDNLRSGRGTPEVPELAAVTS